MAQQFSSGSKNLQRFQMMFLLLAQKLPLENHWTGPFYYLSRAMHASILSVGDSGKPFSPARTTKKNWLIGKNPDAGKDWRQEEKGTTEDEMIGWHHQLDGHEFEHSLGVGDGQRSLACYGQGSLACCSSWGRKETQLSDRIDTSNTIFLILNILGWIVWHCWCLAYEKRKAF